VKFHSELASVLSTHAIRCVYQPVVDLDDGQVVAFEALMRGPAGTSLESPMALLDAAQTDTELAMLDQLAHTFALSEMVSHADGAGRAVFLNVEPRGIAKQLPDSVVGPWVRGRAAALGRGLQLVIELTERALLDDPGLVLWMVGQMRAFGARIALDDVGALPESLAFLPVVRPDVVKLDLRLIQDHGTLEIAQITNAVRAYAEESGADIVAEGVESEADHEVALSLGATLGQGWLYGRPAALPATLGAHRVIARVAPLPDLPGATPFEVVTERRSARLGAKGLLLPISHSLEDAAGSLAIPPLLLGCFQDAQFFTARTESRYERLAQRLPLVGALGVSMPDEPAAGVRGAALDRQDALTGEWDVIVLGAHYAAALVALDHGDAWAAHSRRRFDYIVTHDRSLVIAAAQTMLSRLLRLQNPSTVGHAA
jgi:EAL domain-containing protein (putative c-di-GMP-specific phosphodiesterase class I)